MKIIKFFVSLLKWALMLGITLLALYIISSNFNIFGGYRPFLVQSGSMEPAIMTGDIIVVKDQVKYQINDVITFHNNSNRTVTHRIVAVDRDNSQKFNTKGDANRSGDEDIISHNQVIGKVVLVVPRLGYLVSFAKSRLGLLMLLLIPAILFISDELFKVKNVKTMD